MGGAFTTTSQGKEFGWFKDPDIVDRVSRAARVVGFAGSDVYYDLNDGQRKYVSYNAVLENVARYVVAVPEADIGTLLDDAQNGREVTIATSNRRVANKAARSLSMSNVNIMVLKGSVEAAPKMMGADMVVDIVDTEKTLNDNGLVIEVSANQNGVSCGEVERIGLGAVFLERLGLE